jgi:hypothetical protein
MDVYVSTVAGEPARSSTDAHADGSTFVPREATISGFATNPTRTSFVNARKADRNHGFMFCGRSVRMRSCAQFSFYDRQNSHFMTDEFHFMTDEFHFMTDEFHFMTEPTYPVGSVIK